MRPVFFDTNLVLYLLSADEHKANTAEALLAQGGMVSVQVLNEAVSVGMPTQAEPDLARGARAP